MAGRSRLLSAHLGFLCRATPVLRKSSEIRENSELVGKSTSPGDIRSEENETPTTAWIDHFVTSVFSVL